MLLEVPLRTTKKLWNSALLYRFVFYTEQRGGNTLYILKCTSVLTYLGSYVFVCRSVRKVNSVWGGKKKENRERERERSIKLGSLPTAPLAVYILKQHKDISEQSSHHASHPQRPIICFSFLTTQFSISSHFKTKHNNSHEEVSALLCKTARNTVVFWDVIIKKCWRWNK